MKNCYKKWELMIIRILLAEDHTLVRSGIRSLLEGSKQVYEVVGEASNGRIAVDMARQLDPELVLMDVWRCPN